MTQKIVWFLNGSIDASSNTNIEGTTTVKIKFKASP